ncbi:MAG: beta-glucosidase, partial [Eubacteriales bacterium]
MPETRYEPRAKLWGGERKSQLEDVAQGNMTLEEFLDTLTLEEQVWLLGGQPNTGVANTFGIGNNRDHGIPNVMTADGPAGVRIRPELQVYTTAWPCATMLASTWNRALVEEVGAAGAMELKENNLASWLTPAMNIHR